MSEWTSLPLILRQVRWQDVADILILSVVFFRIYLWLRGTVALQVLVGVAVLLATSFLASWLELTLTAYVLQTISAVATLIIVVVFRTEIRQALLRANPVRWWRERRNPEAAGEDDRRRLARALFALAERRVGALVVIPRADPVAEHLTGGIRLEARISPELLESVFHTGSPLHDGAVVVAEDKVAAAGVVLPLSTASGLPASFGTRHRAGVGLSERCDALVVIVSEERGTVSVAAGGKVASVETASELEDLLLRETGRAARSPAGRLPAFRWLTADAAIFVTILLLVTGAWSVVTGGRSSVVARSVAVVVRNVPPEVGLGTTEPAEVTVYLRGAPGVLAGLDAAGLQAWVDAAGAGAGTHGLEVQVLTPAGVQVQDVEPAAVSVRLGPHRPAGEPGAPQDAAPAEPPTAGVSRP